MRGGVKESENLSDVYNGSPLKRTSLHRRHFLLGHLFGLKAPSKPLSSPSRIELCHDQFVPGGVELKHQLPSRFHQLGKGHDCSRALKQFDTDSDGGKRSVYALYATPFNYAEQPIIDF